MTVGTQRITVEDAGGLAEVTYDWEVQAARDASPTAGPTWLRATDGVDPRIPPCRYLVARRGPGELAVLPMHVVAAPATPDADPRSYFGGSPEAGTEPVCCGLQQISPAAQTLAHLSNDKVFPTLLLGPLTGYKSEILHSFWAPDLAADLIDAARTYARDQHIPTIVAPWIADRGSGKALARELRRRGAVASFWAVEDYLPLQHGSLQAHLAALRSRDRYRYRQDMRAAEALDLSIRALSVDELRDNRERIGALAAANRRRHGQDIAETGVSKVLARLLELGVPLLCAGGFRDSRLVACCVSVIKADRIYAKYAGFDYDTLGLRSGAHFAVVIYGTLSAAYDRGARVVEYGIGAHQAKALRRCQPRNVTSYFLTDRPQVRDIFESAATLNAPHRRAEYATPGHHDP